MKHLTIYYKQIRLAWIEVSAIAFTIAAFFLPSYTPYENTGDNQFDMYVNGTWVGLVDDKSIVEEDILRARRELAADAEGLLLVNDLEVTYEGKEALWGEVDSDETVYENVKNVILSNVKSTLQKAYTVKVNSQTVNLSTAEDVERLFGQTIAQYDPEGKYVLHMALDPERELNVFTAQIAPKEEAVEEVLCMSAGIASAYYDVENTPIESANKDFDDYELGLMDVRLSEDVEVVEAYLIAEDVMSVEEAANLLTEEQEIQQIYEVQSGDTLSEISINVGIPMDTIVEMNHQLLDDVNSTLHVKDQLIITVPMPEISVIWTEQKHYEEGYEAEIIYVPNDDWYTTQKVTLQEPSAGYREVIADITYRNEKEIGREIVKEEVVMEAIPKIVERGTKIPPTYVKPISGGRFTSAFGKRKAPKAGASTYHKGVDWATAVGTPVVASSGGTVAKAGWGSGYGYVVYINHPDGRQTRYGHLSKIYVSAGQTVSQGDKIALSGNSGVSTGPHIHFEILINGKQVNPLEYLN